MSRAANKLITAAAGSAGEAEDDTPFSDVILFLDGDGANNGDNNDFTDGDSSAATLTSSTDLLWQGSFSPYGDNWSVYFDGSGDYLDVGTSNATPLGSGAFTVEFWINSEDTDANLLNPDSSTGTGFWGLLIQSGNLRWNSSYNVTNKWVVNGSPILDGKWHHVAVVRNSNTFSVYYDGVAQSAQSGSFSDSTNYSGSDGLRIGNGNHQDFKGYLSNVRVVSGTAIYTSGFTVPTDPFTASGSYTEKALVCQSNYFVDNGDHSHSITVSGTPKVMRYSPFLNDDARTLTNDGGSVYKEGNAAHYVYWATQIGQDTSWAVDGWVYLTDTPTSGAGISGFWCTGHTLSNVNYGPSFGPDSSQRLMLRWWTGSGQECRGDTELELFAWYHIECSVFGSTIRMWVNGQAETLSGVTSYSQPIGTASYESIISNDYGRLKGYICDLRVSASSQNSSAFTPPTSPVSAFGNSRILMNFRDAAIFDRTGNCNIRTIGDAKISTGTTKYGTGSIKFDGTSDYLDVHYEGDLFDFGSADWTMECWAYLQTDGDSRGGIIEIYKDDNNYIRLFRDTGPDIQLRGASGGTTQFDIQSSAQSLNTWIHIAAVRDGSTIRLFLDGTEVGTDTSFSMPDLSGAQVVVGVDLVSTDRYFTGFIDEVRITKNSARYTSNFTPPTEALPKF